mmetsp:Transcript_11926/g.35377  ORF Transcript_11926/g.35377 Transcript_11926/m.35377 type:complete len:215 (+) Transcript_11926:978-1622(+)
MARRATRPLPCSSSRTRSSPTRPRGSSTTRATRPRRQDLRGMATNIWQAGIGLVPLRSPRRTTTRASATSMAGSTRTGSTNPLSWSSSTRIGTASWTRRASWHAPGMPLASTVGVCRRALARRKAAPVPFPRLHASTRRPGGTTQAPETQIALPPAPSRPTAQLALRRARAALLLSPTSTAIMACLRRLLLLLRLLGGVHQVRPARLAVLSPAG